MYANGRSQNASAPDTKIWLRPELQGTPPQDFCMVQELCHNSRSCLYLILGRKDLAIEMYKKGIEELEKGIAVEITGSGKL